VFKNFFNVSPGDVRKGLVKTGDHISIQNNNGSGRKQHSGKIEILWMTLILIFLTVVILSGLLYLFREKKSVEKSIAILPFDNFKVISRTSSEIFREKGKKTIPEIAEILNVNYILKGVSNKQKEMCESIFN